MPLRLHFLFLPSSHTTPPHPSLSLSLSSTPTLSSVHPFIRPLRPCHHPSIPPSLLPSVIRPSSLPPSFRLFLRQSPRPFRPSLSPSLNPCIPASLPPTSIHPFLSSSLPFFLSLSFPLLLNNGLLCHGSSFPIPNFVVKRWKYPR